MPAVFTYGTLEIPSVMEAVTGRRFAHASAHLRGYARYLVRGRPYPGIVADPDASTPGALYLAVDAESLARLDRFEGDLYERRAVHVRRVGAPHVSAFAYVVPRARADRLSSAPWDRAGFVARHLERYLEACRAFRRDEASRS